MSGATRIRVAMLIQAYHPHVGGAERQLQTLTPRLRERGIDVHVFTRARPPARRHEIVDGAPVTRVPVPGPRVMASLAYTLGANAAMARWRPDIVHAHELLSPTTAAMLAKRLFGCPIVAKALRGGTLGDIEKLQRTTNGRRRLAAAVRTVDAFVVISEEIDRELTAAGVPAERRRFVPNGVDTVRFAPSGESRQRVRQRLDVAADAPVAVYCGRLASEKRVIDLARAWTAAASRVPGSVLWVVGDGPLLAQAQRLVGPTVRVLGEVRDVEEVLAAADVFVLPSDTEGLSNAMLEAMASGLPVVATAVGAAPDLLSGGRAGALVPAGNVDAVVDTVQELLRQPERRTVLGTQGRALVRERYDLEATADGLTALYRALLQQARGRRRGDRVDASIA